MSTEFTPWLSFFGGVLIGLAALILMAAHGRIAGISGILSGWLTRTDSSTPINTAFLVGLVLGLPLTALLSSQPISIENDTPFIGMLMAGLFVGYGTVHGSGCTSGHGVCGISRLSARSMVATATFMSTAIVFTFIVRHVFGA